MANLPPILILDDDPDDIFILRRLLFKADIKNKTVAFEDPKAAIAHLAGEISSGNALFIPCLIFTDLQMPGMDGFEFAKWVRNQPALADSLLVMVSGSHDPKNEVRAAALGINELFLKYPNQEQLAQLFEKGCGSRRKRHRPATAKSAAS